MQPQASSPQAASPERTVPYASRDSYAARRGPFPWGVLALGLLFFVLAVGAFIIRIVTIGTDGATTDASAYAFQPNFVEVYAYPNSPGPLQTRDRVIGVNGITMREWAVRLFVPNSSHMAVEPDTLAVYRVLRKGQPLTMLVGLKQRTFVSVFQARWGFFIFVFVSQVLALWLLIRRPQVPAVRVFFIWAMLGSQMYLWALPLSVGDIVTGYGFWLGRLLVSGMAVLFYPALVHFALYYPRPTGAVRRHSWIIPSLYLGAIVIYFAVISYFWAAAPSILEGLGASSRAVWVISVIYLLAALAIIILQYMHSAPGPDRQRAKWALLGGSIAVVSGLTIGVFGPIFVGRTWIDVNVYGLTLLAFPVSMAIAMWRYHLFDVDFIIRKSFFYFVVTAILVVSYIGAIIFFEAFFRQFTRQTSRPAVALATAIIMLLFNPVRQRVQRAVDRIFYRTNYDAAQMLAHFAATARDEADLPKILNELEQVITTSLQPASIHVWLAPREQREASDEP
ncbi:MAG: hypothetical protein U0X20_31860 [Caldilineaceae bacterium]